MTTRTVTIAGLIAQAVPQLEDAGVETPRLEAEVLAMHVAGMTKAQLYSRWGDGLDSHTSGTFQALLARRLKGEPLAYVVGHREFYSRDFLVDPRVLIPRPETELLVEAALAWAGDRAITIADVGTGSGAIAVSLSAERPDWTIYALDRSADALKVARANAEKHSVAITFLESDLLEPLPQKVDLIVANLPYVRDDQLPQWCGAAQVELSFEPFDALSGGEDGLDVIRRFLPQAPRHLNPGGALFMEIAYDQGAAVKRLAEEAFPDGTVKVSKDLAGLDRIVSTVPAAVAPGSP